MKVGINHLCWRVPSGKGSQFITFLDYISEFVGEYELLIILEMFAESFHVREGTLMNYKYVVIISDVKSNQ